MTNMNMTMFLIVDHMTESIAPPDTAFFGDQERPKRIFKIIVIGDSHVGMSLFNSKVFENILVIDLLF